MGDSYRAVSTWMRCQVQLKCQQTVMRENTMPWTNSPSGTHNPPPHTHNHPHRPRQAPLCPRRPAASPGLFAAVPSRLARPRPGPSGPGEPPPPPHRLFPARWQPKAEEKNHPNRPRQPSGQGDWGLVARRSCGKNPGVPHGKAPPRDPAKRRGLPALRALSHFCRQQPQYGHVFVAPKLMPHRSASLHNHYAALSLVKLLWGGRSDLLVGHPHQKLDTDPLQQQEAEVARSGGKVSSPFYFPHTDIPPALLSLSPDPFCNTDSTPEETGIEAVPCHITPAVQANQVRLVSKSASPLGCTETCFQVL